MPLAVTRCHHVNVNCSDLDQSLAWYGEMLGLTTLVRTTLAEPQPGAAFGLDLAQWDAWILQGATGPSGVVLGRCSPTTSTTIIGCSSKPAPTASRHRST